MPPTLFVLCMDILLGRLSTALPSDSTIRAFADVIGLLVHNRVNTIPILSHKFHRFSQYASLHLDLQETQLIPLSPITPQDLSTLSTSNWQSIDPSSTKGKYLGIYIGPSATPADTLNEISNKFNKRMNHWTAHPLPPSYKFFVYNTFLNPLYSYFAQFS